MTSPTSTSSTTTTTTTTNTTTTTSTTSTTTSTTTTRTIITTTTTTAPGQKCQEGEVPKELKVFQTIKQASSKQASIKTWLECRSLCNDNGRCDYFTWKVNHNGKVCQLIEMIWTTHNSFESGKQFCLTKTTGE